MGRSLPLCCSPPNTLSPIGLFPVLSGCLRCNVVLEGLEALITAYSVPKIICLILCPPVSLVHIFPWAPTARWLSEKLSHPIELCLCVPCWSNIDAPLCHCAGQVRHRQRGHWRTPTQKLNLALALQLHRVAPSRRGSCSM